MRRIIKRLSFPVARANHAEVPEREFSGAIDARANFDHGGRPEGVKKEFLAAVPQNLHRLASDFRESSSLNRLLRGAFASKAAANIRHNDVHFLWWQSQCLRHFLLYRERGLRSRPNRDSVILHRRRGGMRLDWRMRDVAIQIGFLNNRRRKLLALLEVTTFVYDLRFRRVF